MPELPEVETTKRGIAPHVVNKSVSRVLIRNSRLRWPVPSDLGAQIQGQTLRDISRRGKYLLFHFDGGTALWHLGMSGSLRMVSPTDAPSAHDHVDWVFANNIALRFNDPRRFGALLWTADEIHQHPLLRHLGPEPLTDAFDGEYLYQSSRRRSQAIKSWLMDARIVVGVGNIYANEALFASGIHPLKAAHKLTRPKSRLLAAHIKRILELAIQRGGTTLRDFVGGDGKPGYFAQELYAYGRGGKPCKKLQQTLDRKTTESASNGILYLLPKMNALQKNC